MLRIYSMSRLTSRHILYILEDNIQIPYFTQKYCTFLIHFVRIVMKSFQQHFIGEPSHGFFQKKYGSFQYPQICRRFILLQQLRHRNHSCALKYLTRSSDRGLFFIYLLLRQPWMPLPRSPSSGCLQEPAHNERTHRRSLRFRRSWNEGL